MLHIEIWYLQAYRILYRIYQIWQMLTSQYQWMILN
nr:MAG TPA: hypothetical protein [Caudoviricetes sp.]